MKVIVIFLCVIGLMSSYADSDAQISKLNFQIEKGTVKDALEKIEKQTGLSFMYDNNVFNVNRSISLSIENEPIEKVLEELLSAENLKYERINRYIVITPKNPNVFGQARKGTVTGKVTNTLGESIPGVTVVIQGSASGTITDVNGNYSLGDVPENDVLVFSFVGMKTMTIDVNGRKIINVILKEETIGLEEVVAVGYGSLKKKDLTSSITSVSAKELNKGVYSNPIMRLQGKVPGLNITKDGNPNGSAAIILRGPSTLRTGDAQQPLYVIDGVPDGIMPPNDDIVSIDILRDASATAIYGSRASNGVIMITTKRGEAGQAKVSYNGYTAIEAVSNKIDMFSAEEYRSYLSENGLSLAPVDDDGASTDWFDEVSRIGLSHNNNVSISGGNNKTTYFGSINYICNEGIIKETSLKQFQVRSQIEQKALNDRLKLSFSLSNSVKDSKIVPDALYLTMWNYLPTVNIKNEDGTYRENLVRASYNPVALIKQNTLKGRTKVFLTTAGAQLNILKGLDYEINMSYQNTQRNNDEYYNKESALAQGYNGLAVRNSYEDEMKLMETFISYSRSLGKHDFKILGGYSWQKETKNNGFQANSSNFVSDETLYYNLALGSNYEGFIPDYGTQAISELRMISYYSRLNYSFADKYLLQATIRRDGSSAFGRNDRWGYFPSVSVGWRMMEESFIKKLNLFDNLKLRAGYGVSGNSLGFDPMISQLRYGFSGTSYYDGKYINGIGPVQNENPDIQWERTTMFNTGIDFSLFNERLSGTIEYYDKQTKDLIWTYDVSSTEYFTDKYTANIGKISNKGLEVTLSLIPVKTRNLTWNTTLTASHNKNKVKSISNDQFQLDYKYIGAVGNHGQSGMNTQILEGGHPLGQFYLWKYAGKNEEGISQFYAADGTLTVTPETSDRHYAGSAQPKIIGGWYNTITYRNFSLDFLFRGVAGNKVLNVTMSNLNYPAEATHYNLPKMTKNESANDNNAHYTSTRYLEKGNYIRLDNVTLSYNFDLSTPYVKGLRIYTTVNNAFVITDYKGTDPEVYIGGLTPGIDDDNYYPKTRSFLLGVSVDF